MNNFWCCWIQQILLCDAILRSWWNKLRASLQNLVDLRHPLKVNDVSEELTCGNWSFYFCSQFNFLKQWIINTLGGKRLSHSENIILISFSTSDWGLDLQWLEPWFSLKKFLQAGVTSHWHKTKFRPFNRSSLFDMDFFWTISYRGGGEAWSPPSHHNFVFIALMIMKFGTGVKLDVSTQW